MTTSASASIKSVSPEQFRSWDVLRFVLDARCRADPYPVYARLRAHSPVYHSLMGATLVTSYEHVIEVLRSPYVASDEHHVDTRIVAGRHGRGVVREFPGRLLVKFADRQARHGPANSYTELAERLLISLDPPDHTRIRTLASRAFSPRVADEARPMIESIANELLDELAPNGQADLLASFSYPFPILVICRLLGVPGRDHAAVAKHVPDLVRGLDVAGLGARDRIVAANAAATWMDRYFRGLVELRRVDPKDDLLSALIAAADDDDQLTIEELVAFAVLLFAAGHETTANLIGNGLWHLFGESQQLERWRAEPSIRRNGIEELLRYDSPVQMVQRIARRDFEVGEIRIARGRRILALVAAANRDPNAFDDPDRLDVGREHCRPVSFGFGIHHCLGAALARVEAEVALSLLLERFPKLRLATDRARWRPSIIFRGLRELPVRWD